MLVVSVWVLESQNALVLFVCSELEGGVRADARDGGRVAPPEEQQPPGAYCARQEAHQTPKVVRRVRYYYRMYNNRCKIMYVESFMKIWGGWSSNSLRFFF